MTTERAIGGFIFDLDGTMVDSMGAHVAAWQEALAAGGVPVPQGGDLRRRMAGLTNLDIIRELISPPLSLAEAAGLAGEKEAIYRAAYEPSEIRGLSAFLSRLGEVGGRLAVATSAPRANVRHVLDALRLSDAFHAVVSDGDVEPGKPAPDIFLEAASRLRLAPDACLVFEDAISGIAAARGAGMPVVALATSLSRQELEREPGVLLVLDDFEGAMGILAPLLGGVAAR